MRARRFLRPRLMLPIAGVLAAVLSAAPARSKPAASAEPAPEAVDVAAFKDKLEILHDGKKHYVALVPFEEGGWQNVYYGDGKTFHALRIIGSGSTGKEAFDLTFWEPRVKARYQASLELKNGKYE